MLLDRDLLADVTRIPFRLGASSEVSYWIAMALAERLLPADEGTSQPTPLRTLQANCLGGILLGASPDIQSTGDATPLLNTARAAYGDRYSSTVGTASQRGYAFLSGLGATGTTSCSSIEMAALAQSSVPDPALLQQIEQLPPPDRAHSSLMAAINSQCQPRPSKPCPRTISTSRTTR
ncbi:MAG: hypothetical protein DCF23_12050 [Cyanobium sp.]|nr:MAG: hypothetical protein DCF23_12050 [Cyanobium sp.]